MENTETVTVTNKGTYYEIVVQHDQSGSAYGIDLSNEAYEQLRQHFVMQRSEQLPCENCGGTGQYWNTRYAMYKPCKCNA